MFKSRPLHLKHTLRNTCFCTKKWQKKNREEKYSDYLVKKIFFLISFLYQDRKLLLKYKKPRMNLIRDIVVKSIFHFLLINSKGENKQSPSIVQLSIRKWTLILTIISYLLSSLSVFTFLILTFLEVISNWNKHMIIYKRRCINLLFSLIL